jgi:hypothetical protein
MKPVLDKLQLLEIFPSSPASSSKSETAADLIDRIIRRAEHLRRVWASPETTASRRQTSPQAAGQVAVS